MKKSELRSAAYKRLSLKKGSEIKAITFYDDKGVDMDARVESGKTYIFFDKLDAKNHTTAKGGYAYEASATIIYSSPPNVKNQTKEVSCWAVPK